MIPNTHTKDRVIHLLLLSFIGLFLICIGLLSFIIYKEQKLANKIYPNIYIDNINVGGMTKEKAEAVFSKKHTGIEKVTLNIIYKDEQIATLSAQQLDLHSNAPEIVDRAYDIGRSPVASSRLYQKLTTLFKLIPYKFETGIGYDEGLVTDYIRDVDDHYNKPAKNALFSFENGKVTTFREHENGLMINNEKFVNDIKKSIASLEKKTENKKITVTDSAVKPEITLSEANEFGIEELIGEGQSDYHHSSEDRIHNLTLAASKFNGAIIEKGKEFSFNQILGDVSTITGYVPGYVILNGKTVLGDGGGVCQVSTTMFRAALNTGLPITERHNHAYRVVYYENDQPAGLDATIYLPGVDLKVKNDTPAAILIQTEIDPDNLILYFRLYGKKDGRVAEIDTPVLSNQQPPPPAVTQEDPTLPRGVTKLVEHAIPGATSTFNYKVYKGKEITYQQKFVSWYRPWAQVTLVGTKD
ncbi:MAG: VanW family protein [Patescibacteria group bacterium]